MNRKSAFIILNIPIDYENLNEELLKKYYKHACLKTHPDKKGCNEDFVKVKDAYDFLKKDLQKFSTKYNDEDIDLLYYDVLFNYLVLPIYYYFHKNTFELNPTLYNLINKDMYYFKQYNTYIPLWHREIELNINEQIQEKKNKKINIIIKPLLPTNTYIDNDNNIYINIDKNTDKYIIGNTSYFIPIHENNKYFKGIPRINEKNIYDVTNISDLIFIRK
jgi:hypothetical protein